MNKTVRRILEITVIVLIAGLSVMVFLLRDKLQNFSNLGYLGVFLLCFLANSTVLLPAPSLMIAASCALIMNPWLVALTGSLGSALGEFVGYGFGVVTDNLSPRFSDFLDKLTTKIRSRTVLVFILALLPLPIFDVAGIYSGGTRLHALQFFAACFVGKFLKMLVYTRVYDIIGWASELVPALGGIV